MTLFTDYEILLRIHSNGQISFSVKVVMADVLLKLNYW